MRQAVAYGLDRAGVVKSFYAGRGTVANEFMPPQVVGYSKTVPKYTYNPEKAKQLLQQAGLTLPVEVDFWYPTDVSRPYMPDPAAELPGVRREPRQVRLQGRPERALRGGPDYLGPRPGGQGAGSNLIGWTGDFGDPDNFVGTFFRTKQAQWGFNNPQLFALLNKALTRRTSRSAPRSTRQANNMIMKFLPGVPYVHTKPALAFQKNVIGLHPEPGVPGAVRDRPLRRIARSRIA